MTGSSKIHGLQMQSGDGIADRERPKIDAQRVEAAVHELLLALGEDPSREGLLGTPDRVARAYGEMLAGREEDASQVLARTFSHRGDDLVVLRNVRFWSLCEHHLLPFTGRAHIAYRPGGARVVGLSKLARLVDVYARRLQLQERLTAQISDQLMESLEPRGVTVVVEAEHLCLQMRGARKEDTSMRTMAHRGDFEIDAELRREVLSLLGAGAVG